MEGALVKLTDIIKLGGKPRKVYRQETPGTYNLTFPADVAFGIVTLQAGGGNGACVNITYVTFVGGGSSGMGIIELPMPIKPGVALQAIVGAGAPQRNGSYIGENGSNGGNTSFNGIVAYGGHGGKALSAAADLVSPGDTVAAATFAALFDKTNTSPHIWARLNAKAILSALDFVFPSIKPVTWSGSAFIQPTLKSADVARLPFGYGTDTTNNGRSIGGGAPSFFAVGGNGFVGLAGDAANAGLLGSGGGAVYGHASLSTSPIVGKGGDGFIEIIYFSDGTVAVS
jgi:hypothetical protein